MRAQQSWPAQHHREDNHFESRHWSSPDEDHRLLVVTWCLILIHLAEITVWALFYLWAGCLPDAEAAFYFSRVTYATIGYGDVVLQAAVAAARRRSRA